jgi:predicted Rossmann fold nucleotide-binding protein DprA/Smf involved in DNA uptake
MKLIIAGSRSLEDYSWMEAKLNKILSDTSEPVVVISGGAKGADRLGERYAEERGFEVVVMPAEWEKHGKKAGYLRNKQMAEQCTHAVIFWDGESPGSRHMISICENLNIPHRVIRIVK